MRVTWPVLGLVGLCSTIGIVGCGSDEPGTVSDTGVADTTPTDVGPSKDTGSDTSSTDSAMGDGADTALAVDSEVGTDSGASDSPALSDAFKDIYDTFLTPRCASCHSKPAEVGRLDLSGDARTAYANLVNQPVWTGCPRKTDIRVVPFDPTISVVMLFNSDGPCGRRHNLLLTEATYPTADRTADLAKLEAWIKSGAK